MATAQRIGFIGLGAMGTRMARNIQRAGYPLTIYDRTPTHAEELRRGGATVAESARAVAADVDVVITMLSDPNAVRAVATGPEGLLAGAHAGLVHIDMSTVGPADARDLVAMESPHGVQVLHAPVLGSTGPAEREELIVLVGGDQASAEAQRSLLQTIGKTVHYLGANEHACAMKLAMNVLLAGTMQLCGEAVALAMGWGVMPEQALAIITESPTAAPMLKTKATTIFDPQAPAEFALHLTRKDLWLATTAAYQKTVALPLAAAALETYSMAMLAHGNEDVGRIAAFIVSLSDPR